MLDIAGVALIVAIVSPIVWDCAKLMLFKEERDYRAIIKNCEELSKICRELIDLTKDSSENMRDMFEIIKEHSKKIEELSAGMKH